MAKTAAKRPAKTKKTAGTVRGKKKVAARGKKKVAVKKKAPATPRKKSVGKKAGKKKAAKRTVTKPRAVKVQTQLEKRVEKLTAQLDEMRDFLQKEVAKDLENTRKYADAEMAIQKRRFDQVLEKIKQENHEIRSRMSKFLEEHEVLKGVTKGIADTAKSLEERVRKIVSG